MMTLGKISALLITELYNMNKYIFKTQDAQIILGDKYIRTRALLKELVDRNIITRLKAGKYLIIPQEIGDAKKYIGQIKEGVI